MTTSDSWGSEVSEYDVLPGKDWILRCASNGRIVLRCLGSDWKSEFVARCREYCRKVAKKRGAVTLRVRDLEGFTECSYHFPEK